MNHQPQRAIVPIYTSRGDAEAFLVYPYLHNRMGEWIGWVTADRQVYSVLGFYVGELTAEPRIIRKRITASLKPRKTPPPPPARLLDSCHHPAGPHDGRPALWCDGYIARGTGAPAHPRRRGRIARILD